jgi:hypothetical protein
MNIHVLEADRFEELAPIFKEYGGALPDPSQAIILVLEDTPGVIDGFWVLEAQIHIEPVWVRPELRNKTAHIYKAILPHLLAALHDTGASKFYSFAEDQQTATYLARIGLSPMTAMIFEGRVPPKDLDYQP